jgi:single-strand DNA-binding protein
VDPLHHLGQAGRDLGQLAHKGSRVYVAGRLHTSRWEDAQTGEARSSVEIVVDDLILLDRPTPQATPEDEQDAGEPQPSLPAPTPRPSAQQPIRRPPQPVQLRDSSAQPPKRRHNDR